MLMSWENGDRKVMQIIKRISRCSVIAEEGTNLPSLDEHLEKK